MTQPAVIKDHKQHSLNPPVSVQVVNHAIADNYWRYKVITVDVITKHPPADISVEPKARPLHP